MTLYEEVHPANKLSNRVVQHQFMKRLAALPSDILPTIVADSGFRTPFYRYVEQHLGWHWVGRIRGRDMIFSESGDSQWTSVKALFAIATTRAKRRGRVQWVRNHPLSAYVTVIRQPKKYREKLTVRGLKARSRHSAVNRKRNSAVIPASEGRSIKTRVYREIKK